MDVDNMQICFKVSISYTLTIDYLNLYILFYALRYLADKVEHTHVYIRTAAVGKHNNKCNVSNKPMQCVYTDIHN